MTAALLNAHVRDDLLETSAATVTTAGDLAYADAANSMGKRLAIGAAGAQLTAAPSNDLFWRTQGTDVDTGNNTMTSTSYITLGSVGFASEVEVSIVTGTSALVLFKAQLNNNGAGNWVAISYSVSGATTVAAAANHSIMYESGATDDQAEFAGFDLRTGLTAGTNVFTLEAKVNAGTGTVTRPEIVVIAY